MPWLRSYSLLVAESILEPIYLPLCASSSGAIEIEIISETEEKQKKLVELNIRQTAVTFIVKNDSRVWQQLC